MIQSLERQGLLQNGPGTEKAVVDKLATICVAQFQQDLEKEQKRKALEETTSYEFVKLAF